MHLFKKSDIWRKNSNIFPIYPALRHVYFGIVVQIINLYLEYFNIKFLNNYIIKENSMNNVLIVLEPWSNLLKITPKIRIFSWKIQKVGI